MKIVRREKYHAFLDSSGHTARDAEIIYSQNTKFVFICLDGVLRGHEKYISSLNVRK